MTCPLNAGPSYRSTLAAKLSALTEECCVRAAGTLGCADGRITLRQTASDMVGRLDDGPRARMEADTIMATETEPKSSPLSAPLAKVDWAKAGRLLLFAAIAIAAIGLAAWPAVVVARGTQLTTAHRAAAAWTALLVVAALAIVAQVILAWYQASLSAALPVRRRGLKAAVIGKDGRASTSKTQVVLWTAAVVWALVDLLLLARAYPGGSLFINAATTNWRPEYLVLLGLPVAAAATAKAVVAGANSGQGPASSKSSDTNSMAKIASRLNVTSALNVKRVYVRDPADEKGFFAGVAELFTGDDNAVDWGDLQYVVFTLITLAYFVIQFLVRPADGLPAVPAALLTLMGVSASGYAANKIVQTKVNTTEAPTDGQ